jgi:membrane-bound lytic murein transglycosylase D
VSQLVALNQLSSQHRIQIGQRLLLPQDPGSGSQLVADTAPDDGLYTVRRGDTVSLIAARYGVTESDLLGANGIPDRNRIYPGQQIRLPGFDTDETQVAVIDGNMRPIPPTQVQFADGVVVGGEAIEEPEPDKPAPPPINEETTVELALTEELLPPAAVLPDDQELESVVTQEEQDAEAIDPEIDVAESNEQLVDDLSADPSDYTVASNNTIEIQASETLGHYAEWLGIRAWDIRRLNNMAYRDPVIIGERLRLDFSRVNIAEFERARRGFHSTLQGEFFANYRIQDVETYNVSRGDNIGRIARERYSTPIWLLRQYNPELDFNRIQIGQEIVFPLLEQVE